MRWRTVFLSDIHLGTRACQADRLLDFLRENPCEQLYLVGDIVDFWAMSRGVHWSSAQNTVVQKILRAARHGTRVVFIPGNHDEALRDHCDSDFGGIRIEEEAIHVTADGRRLLIVHGDAFDQVTRHHRWVAVLGDISYNLLVRGNIWLSRLRRLLGLQGYWSLAGYAKRKIKKAINFIFDFEDSVMRHVIERGLDGVVCGHIHWPRLEDRQGRLYANCGDWVDSCSALAEDDCGQLHLLHWQPEIAGHHRPGTVETNIPRSHSRHPADEEETACVS